MGFLNLKIDFFFFWIHSYVFILEYFFTLLNCKCIEYYFEIMCFFQIDNWTIFFFFFQFRNQYDNDVTTWSPQGRLHQVEYAMEAVKQGSATVGVKSKTHAVLVALKRASSELSAYQKKIMNLDDHMGMSIAGITW